jgi:hypothetical protein
MRYDRFVRISTVMSKRGSVGVGALSLTDVP